jgi:PAS domain-containing protein
MKLPHVVRDVLIIGMAFLGLQTWQAILLKRAMGQEENLLAYRLASGMAGVFNQAHKAKDDLSIFRVLDALTQGPGIIQARIVAHASPDSYSYPLQDGTHSWGALVLSISDHFSRTLITKQWLAGTAAAALIWGVLFLYLQSLERRKSKLQIQIAEFEGLLQAEKRKLSRFQERERLKAMQNSAALQKAIHQISDPRVVLDSQQRVSAINQGALDQLGLAESQTMLGKSWNELPILGSCGQGLERSLAVPGQVIEWPMDGGRMMKIETDAYGMAGTWISISVE